MVAELEKVFLLSAVRSPVGAFQGALAALSEQQLAAYAMKEAVRRAGIDPDIIDEVIVGIAKQTSRPSNGGRHALLLAGLPEKIPAYTVQRQSASGLQALFNGYWALACGDAQVVLAGGAESMSRIPFEIYEARYSFRGNSLEIVDPLALWHEVAEPEGGGGTKTAIGEDIARKYALSEGEQQDFATASWRRRREAVSQGLCGEEIFPVSVPGGRKEEIVKEDQLQRRATTIAPFADGAAMCVLAGGRKARAMGLSPLAEIVSCAVTAASPGRGFLAAAEAGRLALRRAGISLAETAVILVNEFSAAECLAVIREWQSDGLAGEILPKIVNPLGGALAVGNPAGASAAILTVEAAWELRRRNGRYALVATAAEGGQGMAMLLKNTDGLPLSRG